MPSTLLADCVQPLADAFLALREDYEAAHPGVKIAVDCTYRSPEEQFELYKHGRRKLDDGSWVVDDDPQTSIVTQLDGFKKRSKHNSRPAAAIDCRIIIQGKTSWRLADYLEVGRLAQERDLVWGGTWGAPVDTVWERAKAGGFVDAPHLEVKE